MVIHAIKWSDEMTVGMPALDEDHRRLVVLMNKVIAACYAGVGNAMINTAMNELEAYTKEHFVREETLLEAKNDPNLAAHKQQHQELISQLAEMKSQKHGTEIIPILYRWLVVHIMETDRGYSHLFR